MLDSRRWHPNVRWLAVRIAALPVMFVVVSFASYFLLFGPIGEDPAVKIGGQGITSAQRQQITEELNLDEPLMAQYAIWLGDFVCGDFGRAYFNDRSIRSELRDRLPPTIELLVASFIIALLFGSAIAYVASRGDGYRGAAIVICASMTAIPIFVTLTLAIIVPAAGWNYSQPVGGYISVLGDPVGNFRVMFPASLLVGFATAPIVARALMQSTTALSRRDWFPTCVRVLSMWFSAGLAAILVAERIVSVRGAGEWFFVATFQQDLAVIQVLICGVTFLGVALAMFAPASIREGVVHPVRAMHPSLRNLTIAGAAILGAMIFISLVGPALSPHDPRALSVDTRFEGPSWSHWLGTTRLGQDVFAREMVAVRNSLVFAGLVVAFAALPGFALGLIALRIPIRYRDMTLRVGSLPLGIPMLWWLITIVVVVERFDRLSTILWLALLATAFVALSIVHYVTSVVGRGDTARAVSLSTALALCQVFAAVTLLLATLEYLGLILVDMGEPSLGYEIAESMSEGIEYPHLIWGSSLFLVALLFAMNLIAFALNDRTRDSTRKD